MNQRSKQRNSTAYAGVSIKMKLSILKNLDSRAAKRVTNKGNNMADKMVLLYNIRVDPYETINLVNVRPDIAMNLLGRLARYDNSSLPVQDPKNDRR